MSHPYIHRYWYWSPSLTQHIITCWVREGVGAQLPRYWCWSHNSSGVTPTIHALATRVPVCRGFAASLSSLLVAKCSSSNLVDNIEGKFCTVSIYPPPPHPIPSCEQGRIWSLRCVAVTCLYNMIPHEWGTLGWISLQLSPVQGQDWYAFPPISYILL